MSGNVSNDLESMITFRSHLMTFDRTLREEFSTIRSHWQSLNSVWNDAKYLQFGATLDSAVAGIAQYLASTEEYEAHLLKLIQILKAYVDA